MCASSLGVDVHGVEALALRVGADHGEVIPNVALDTLGPQSGERLAARVVLADHEVGEAVNDRVGLADLVHGTGQRTHVIPPGPTPGTMPEGYARRTGRVPRSRNLQRNSRLTRHSAEDLRPSGQQCGEDPFR